MRKSFVAIFIYLFIVFGLLSLHAWVVLSTQNISYRFYGLALINALVLSKVILVAEGVCRQIQRSAACLPGRQGDSLHRAAACRLRRRGGSRRALARQGSTESVPAIGGGTISGWLAVALISAPPLLRSLPSER